MPDSLTPTQAAVKYEAVVQPDGRIELVVPFAHGSRVTVFVIQEPPEVFDDLVAASTTSLAFWDNPYDDEDWNNA
jgi:hypothetical protein